MWLRILSAINYYFATNTAVFTITGTAKAFCNGVLINGKKFINVCRKKLFVEIKSGGKTWKKITVYILTLHIFCV